MLLLKNVNLQSPLFVYVEKKINAHFWFYLDIYTAVNNLSFINVFVYVCVYICLCIYNGLVWISFALNFRVKFWKMRMMMVCKK